MMFAVVVLLLAGSAAADCPAASSQWCTDGNQGTPTHILGTTTPDRLRLFANNGERMSLLFGLNNISRVTINGEALGVRSPSSLIPEDRAFARRVPARRQ
jgi:hypothetical protein